MTPAQQAVYDAVVAYIDEYGYSPSIPELAEQLGVWPNAVKDHLIRLERDGWLTRQRRIPRSIVIVKRGKPPGS